MRSDTSLLQTIGRTARNVHGKVLMYADKVTGSMERAIDETERRRKKQADYNRKHGITPKSIKKEISNILTSIYEKDYTTPVVLPEEEGTLTDGEIPAVLDGLRKQMRLAAKKLDFEEAARIRDQIQRLEDRHVMGL